MIFSGCVRCVTIGNRIIVWWELSMPLYAMDMSTSETLEGKNNKITFNLNVWVIEFSYLQANEIMYCFLCAGSSSPPWQIVVTVPLWVLFTWIWGEHLRVLQGLARQRQLRYDMQSHCCWMAAFQWHAQADVFFVCSGFSKSPCNTVCGV